MRTWAAEPGSSHCFPQPYMHWVPLSQLHCMHDAPSDLQVLRDSIQDELYLQLCGLRPGRDLRAAVCVHAVTVSKCAHTGKIAFTR